MRTNKVVVLFLFVGLCGSLGLFSAVPLAAQEQDLVIVEDQPWLVAITTPILTQLSSQKVALLAFSQTAEMPQGNLLVPYENCMVIASTPMGEEFANLKVNKQLSIGQSPAQASRDLALQFWKKSDQVVVVPREAPGLVILGSALATKLQVPLLLIEKKPAIAALEHVIEKLQVQQVLCLTKKASFPTLALKKAKNIQLEQVYQLLASDASKITNLVVSKVSDHSKVASLAPYLAYLREATIFLTTRSEANKVAKQVHDYLEKYQLRPKTLTILGDEELIGVSTVEVESPSGGYQVEVEPCAMPIPGEALSLGVGRIPWSDSFSASLLISQGFFRKQVLVQKKPEVLLVANPDTEYGALPLAETVSRATAEEFHNRGIAIHTFYGQECYSPEVLEKADRAHLIIYEGHVIDQMIFPSNELFEEEVVDMEMEMATTEEEPQENDAASSQQQETDEPTITFYDFRMPESLPHELMEQIYQDANHHNQPSARDLQGMPLVILQSCSSLEEEVARPIFTAGGIGLIGSVTSIHSASGSSFIKTFCDALIYHNMTVGEAFCYAKNYFLALAELKIKRNHKETAKAMRVALSFRYWGDPEMRLDLHPKATKLPTVQIVIEDPEQVLVVTPKELLPESHTQKYYTQMFPGSQLAGLVKRDKQGSQRRLLPLYFSRFELTQQRSADTLASLHSPEDSSHRTVVLFDSQESYGYLLYFPKEVIAQREIRLVPQAAAKTE